MSDTQLDIEALSRLKALRDFLPEFPDEKDEHGHLKHGHLYERDENGNLKYRKDVINPYVEPLLESIGLKGWKYTLWRFQTSFWWEDLPGAVNIVPIRVISPGARSDPGGVFGYGIMRTIDGSVSVEPRLEAVFAVPP
ncbi:hypothetical protein BO78DRAFT_52244 [Aspergillus sclerotiicarbonarius CBS 121057]|uniref:Uncharacterized protein n=1 Tax=Aspergillus sclerotiicarbonarius (strain CBS 121057 / IBT 28362) TaxID=1448318 RepID=A0A319EEZ7_ASPSB|nr:hypothetical protein BO78DRAFT_52244 [Aspergillus sclerotiicarbonarius CBS 121057]